MIGGADFIMFSQYPELAFQEVRKSKVIYEIKGVGITQTIKLKFKDGFTLMYDVSFIDNRWLIDKIYRE